MKRYALLAATTVVGGAIAFQGSVNLQATTPGTAQTGNLNITGTAKAGVLVGYSTTPSGIAYGGDFRSASTSGRGVLGNASATTGATYGGLFQTFSNGGRGVAGIAQNSAGTTYGGFFSSLSNQGRGVYGQATSASGTTYGVYGTATSPTGYGVYSDGRMHATGVISGNGSGLTALSAANISAGVLSAARLPVPLQLAGTSSTAIIRAQNNSTETNAAGVSGIVTTLVGTVYGVFGQAAGITGAGVYGKGGGTGVWGEGAFGVQAFGVHIDT